VGNAICSVGNLTDFPVSIKIWRKCCHNKVARFWDAMYNPTNQQRTRVFVACSQLQYLTPFSVATSQRQDRQYTKTGQEVAQNCSCRQHVPQKSLTLQWRKSETVLKFFNGFKGSLWTDFNKRMNEWVWNVHHQPWHTLLGDDATDEWLLQRRRDQLRPHSVLSRF